MKRRTLFSFLGSGRGLRQRLGWVVVVVCILGLGLLYIRMGGVTVVKRTPRAEPSKLPLDYRP